MRVARFVSLLLLTCTVAACASHPTYEPVTDKQIEVYLAEMHDDPLLAQYGDGSLAKLGAAACVDMRKGVAPLEVVKEAVQDGLPDTQARRVVSSAQLLFCPDVLSGDPTSLVTVPR